MKQKTQAAVAAQFKKKENSSEFNLNDTLIENLATGLRINEDYPDTASILSLKPFSDTNRAYGHTSLENNTWLTEIGVLTKAGEVSPHLDGLGLFCKMSFLTKHWNAIEKRSELFLSDRGEKFLDNIVQCRIAREKYLEEMDLWWGSSDDKYITQELINKL